MNPDVAASDAPTPSLARVIPRDAHGISRSRISPDALRVLYRLRDAGYQAFLVGGCVRDLMLGLEPKDFDVATNAHPEQVKRLFRNCRLVGRRFRLAHVFFGREIIEVATFRAAGVEDEPEDVSVADELESAGEFGADDGLEGDESADERVDAPAEELPAPPEAPAAVDATGERVVDSEGRILRDNVYGTIDQDVWRRDFTANALYYNIADFSVWDFVGGAEDVLARRLRLIGDPETRYREDPVRMLRAARFEAKLGFGIEPATAEPIAPLAPLLAGVPPARLFDETLKLFLAGHAVASLEVLQRRGLLAALLPEVADCLERFAGSPIDALVRRGLAGTDARVAAGRPVTPSFLFAILLYGPVAVAIESAPRERWNDLGTIIDAVERSIRSVQRHVSLPRRFALGVREMFVLQPRLEAPRGRRALRLLEHPRLRAAYDLLALRAECGLASREIVAWWAKLQQASPEQRAAMAEEAAAQGGPGPGAARSGNGGGRGGRRRRRGGRGRSGG